MQLRRILQLSCAASAAAPALLDSLATTQCLVPCLEGFAAASSCTALWRSAVPAIAQRHFASQQQPSGGPPESKIRAVSFTVTPFEAQQTFDEHHAKSWLHKRPSGGDCLQIACLDTSTGSLRVCSNSVDC